MSEMERAERTEMTTADRCPLCGCDVVLVCDDQALEFRAECACGCATVLV